jgi:solute carrier family 6 amino acid transporter-like protein 5/7/9/14
VLCAGIGVCFVNLNALVSIYYNVIIALSLFYLFSSFTSELPWSSCSNPWNTPLCGDPRNDTNTSYALFNMTSSAPVAVTTLTPSINETLNRVNVSRSSPSDEFFR